MKWYNEDKTASLDLEKIVYWEYQHGTLFIWFGSETPKQFRGDSAQQIYKMLTSTKEVI